MSGTALRAPAVVVGLDCITGLQSARLLAARGIPVVGIAAQPRHFCARTRVVDRVVVAPTSGEALVDALDRLAAADRSAGRLFLLPCTDPAVLTISAARDRLSERFRFVLPEDDLLRRLVDKVAFAELATSLDLPIPPTRVLRDRRDVEPAVEALRFPAVVKPPVKTPLWLASAGAKAIRVGTPAELVAVADRAFNWSDTLIAQSWIAGGEDRLISCNAYFDERSAPLATFMARKIRQWPPDTGTSCLGEEIRDDEALGLAVRLFQAVGYRGLAYLEVKRDAVTGELGIVEPNLGRPTGRSSIAERGGVELLATAYADAIGLPLPARRTQGYRGVKWIYWRHDLQAAAVRYRRRELTIGGWLRSIRGPSIEAVGSVRDPLPFLLDVGGTLRTALRAGTRAVARRVRRRPAAVAEP